MKYTSHCLFYSFIFFFFSIAPGTSHVRHACVFNSLHTVNITFIVYFTQHTGAFQCMRQLSLCISHAKSHSVLIYWNRKKGLWTTPNVINVSIIVYPTKTLHVHGTSHFNYPPMYTEPTDHNKTSFVGLVWVPFISVNMWHEETEFIVIIKSQSRQFACFRLILFFTHRGLCQYNSKPDT